MVFNKKHMNFNKLKKKKAREKRKTLGLEEKHKAAAKRSSGLRTKKSLRKAVHKERVAASADKVALAMGDEAMADVSKSSVKRKSKKQKKKGGATAAAAAAAAAAPAEGGEMQE